MTKTQNYNLNQWEPTDPIRREDFNADNAAIDAALKNCGNCRITTGSYTGTGTYGADNANSLTFDFEPKLVLIFAPNSATTRMMWTPGMAMACTDVKDGTSYYVFTSYSDNTLSWYNTNSNLGPSKQLNIMNSQYFYLVFG